MNFARISRRSFLAAATAALIALPLAAASAAGFTSDRITVRTVGSGPDVVLIPGLNSSSHVWDSTVAAVPGYRYHVVQVSGFAGQLAGGNSEGDVAAPAAEEIARYIKETGQHPAVVGHSMGGTMGMMLAARHPESLSRLMVVDMWPFLGAMFGGPNATAASLQPMADQVAARMRAATPEERRKRAVDIINSYVNTESMRADAIEQSLSSDTDVSIRAFRELILTNMGPELPRIKVPTTVLYVQPNGSPLSEAQIDVYYKASYAPLKGAVLKRIRDSAHYIMWDQPQRFQAELKAFLEAR